MNRSWRLPDHLRELLDGGEDVIREILELFLADVPLRRDRLAAAIANGDADVVRQEGHSLKGGCAQIGADALAPIAARWEYDAFERESAEAILRAFDAEFARVASAIRGSGLSNQT